MQSLNSLQLCVGIEASNFTSTAMAALIVSFQAYE
jgi:hypothetical protein